MSSGLPELVQQLVKMPLAWDENFVVLGSGQVFTVDEKGNRHLWQGKGGQPLEDLLRDPDRGPEAWSEALLILRKWMMQHRSEVGDLFSHPEHYPPFVVWIALCVLKFTDEQGEAIRQFLTRRVFRKIEWVGLKRLHEHLGHTGKRDHSGAKEHFKPEELKSLTTDIESELYEHFVTAVLKDTRQAVSKLFGYLRRAAQNRLRDLYDQTRATSRPALERPPMREDEADEEPETEEEALSRLRRDDLAAEASEQLEGVEATEDSEVQDLLDQLRLTPSQRKLAVLLIQNPDESQRELARRMEVSPAAVTQMLKRMATNPAFLKRRVSRRPTSEPAP